MVHWGFLIFSFFAGAATCYGILYYFSKVYNRVIGAIEKAAKAARYE